MNTVVDSTTKSIESTVVIDFLLVIVVTMTAKVPKCTEFLLYKCGVRSDFIIFGSCVNIVTFLTYIRFLVYGIRIDLLLHGFSWGYFFISKCTSNCGNETFLHSLICDDSCTLKWIGVFFSLFLVRGVVVVVVSYVGLTYLAVFFCPSSFPSPRSV